MQQDLCSAFRNHVSDSFHCVSQISGMSGLETQLLGNRNTTIFSHTFSLALLFFYRHIGHVGWDPNTGFDVSN